MDTAKVALGCLFLAVSCVVFAQIGAVPLRVPLSMAALGSATVGAGTLLADAVSA